MTPYEEFNLQIIMVLLVFIGYGAVTVYQINKRMEDNAKVYYGEINGVYE